MDELANPYRPGAGTPPPALTGRDDLINRFGVAFRRAVAGRPGKSILMIGLRGAGKTVLLNRFAEIAEQEGFRVGLIEAPEHGHFPSLLAGRLRRILLPLSTNVVSTSVTRALRVLKTFTLQLPDGTRVSIDVEALRGVADSGNLAEDVTDLLVACGEAARDRGTGIVLAVDELQYVPAEELSALVVAIHRTNQLNLPVILTGAGLPQLRALVGEAKSYAERLFDFPEIGSLGAEDARTALAVPAEESGARIDDDALDIMVERSHGYPYFLQEWGYHVWNVASQSPITADDVERAAPRVQDQLDQNFFLVRLDRLTPREREYLGAMASLGPGPHRSGDVAAALGVRVESVAPRRAALIAKGIIYSPAHGDTAFTVPLFDEFLKRVDHRSDPPWVPPATSHCGEGSLAEPVDTVLRIGNASGFYGDRFSAFREMLDGGQLDVLTGDYLAELTMLILARQRLAHPDRGYAGTFLRQMEDCLGIAVERGVTIVSNAGGLNPSGLAAALRDLARRLGVRATVASVEGDDVTGRAAELGLGSPLAASAYLGAWGIAECIRSGAQVVITGRVTDASLVVGPAAAHFGWDRNDWDALAGATVAGHILECGAQATGGNYSFFTEHDVRHPGFPIAEVRADGSSVITKHEGTGGTVTIETVTAQLLYEIDGPGYLGPDVVARFDSIHLHSDGADRVRVTGVRGEAPPPTLKVGCNSLSGFRNAVTFVLCGTDIEAKAALVRDQMTVRLASAPPQQVRWTLARTDHPDADDEEAASALLHCTVRDPDPAIAGRGFSGHAVELGLGSYPGFHLTAPPGDASPIGVFHAGFVAANAVAHVAVLDDGRRIPIAPSPETRIPGAGPADAAADLPQPLASGPTRPVPLGTIAGARSGDKGGDANLGVWARDDQSWRWLAHALTVDVLRRLLPETAGLPIRRHVFANLRALNFVISGLLGDGVASSTRFDPQAKALGEWLRSRIIDIPEELL